MRSYRSSSKARYASRFTARLKAMPRATRLILLTLAASLVPSLAFGQGGLNDARQFRAFHVYFAGHHVDSLPLAGVDVFGKGRGGEVIANYGKCKRIRHTNGCAYQLSIDNVSMCRIYPGIYYDRPHLRRIRGAKGGWAKDSHSFDVFTGRTAVLIRIFSRVRSERAAFHLRNVRRSLRAWRLPVPNRRLLYGNASCQQRGQPPGP